MTFETIVIIFMVVTAFVLTALIMAFIEQNKKLDKCYPEYQARLNEKITENDIGDIRCDIRAMERYLDIKKVEVPPKVHYTKRPDNE